MQNLGVVPTLEDFTKIELIECTILESTSYDNNMLLPQQQFFVKRHFNILDMTGAGAQKILNNAARLVLIGKQRFKTFSVGNMPLQ